MEGLWPSPKVIGDRGSIFVSAFMRELYRLLGIELNPSTAYHPQTDGQTERINQEVEQYLRLFKFVNHRQDDWAEWLAIAEFALNNRTSSATGYSPFYINYGKHPRRPLEPLRGTTSKIERVDEQLRKETTAALQLVADSMKRNYDAYHLPVEVDLFKPGDKILLSTRDISSDRPSENLDHKRYGPFTILKKVGSLLYKLCLLPSWRIHDIFHASKLTPFQKLFFDSQLSDHTDDLVAKTQYPSKKIKTILNHHFLRHDTLYLVEWLDLLSKEASWESEYKVQQTNGTTLRLYKENNGLSLKGG